MGRDVDLIAHAKIASPCSASWADMKGNDRIRFCEACKLHVYNFAEMTRSEVKALIIEKEGNLCARLYQRADGTMITKECPVGLRAARKRFARAMGRIAAVFTLLACGASVLGTRGHLGRLRNMEPFSRIYAWFAPSQPIVVMGSICVPPPTGNNAPSEIDDCENDETEPDD
ncbi:MAG: hypothetical protein MI923_07565 [Phycisphaerales bacterium]|nr:hypothetical protein [Phycisphaerales bacterium]